MYGENPKLGYFGLPIMIYWVDNVMSHW